MSKSSDYVINVDKMTPYEAMRTELKEGSQDPTYLDTALIINPEFFERDDEGNLLILSDRQRSNNYPFLAQPDYCECL